MTFKLIRNKILKINVGFESLHGIPYNLNAIDGSHIPIVAPKVDPKSYHCRKRFYSTLIQGIVDAMCSFWIMIMGGQEVSMTGLFSKKIGVRNPCDEEQILTF